jgi:hypothetical protein
MMMGCTLADWMNSLFPSAGALLVWIFLFVNFITFLYDDQLAGC